MSSFFSNIHSTLHTLYLLCSLGSIFVNAIVAAFQTAPYIKNNAAELILNLSSDISVSDQAAL